MLHNIRERQAPRSIPLTIVVNARLAIGALLLLFLSARAAAQDAPPAWADRLDSLVTSELARTLTPGAQVAVAMNGRVIFSRGYGVADIESGRAVRPQTLFRVGSATKMVTGAVLAQLAVEGKLDLRAPISRYVPELAGRRVGTVTTHQLLTHTAGWLDNASAYGRMGEGALGEVMRVQSDTLFFTDTSRVISYSNPGYSMAGYVAERAADRRFGDLAEEMVLRKMSMPYATFRPLVAITRDFSQGHIGQPGNAGTIVRPFTENTAQWAAGFLFASAQEMARFTIAVMDGGRLDAVQVLPPEAVRLMTTGDPRIPGDSVARYAFGLQLGARGSERVWQHGGAINGFDAQVLMFPDRKLSVVILDNRSGAPLQGIVDLVTREVAGIAPPPQPVFPAPRVATIVERRQLVGVYAQGLSRMEIAVEGDTLVMKRGHTVSGVRLIGEERIRVTSPTGSMTVLLVRNASGRVEYLHLGLRALARQP